MDLVTCVKNIRLRQNSNRPGRKSALFMGLSLVLCIALADMPMLGCTALAENSADKVVLEFDALSDRTHTYQVLISETVYSDGQRLTNLYREDFKVEETSATNGNALRTVVCVGSVSPVGGGIKKLDPSGYYLTVDKTGRIIDVRALKPWAGRRFETIWLAQALLPEYPVRPGDTWTVNDTFFSMTTAGKTHEKRAYRFLGTESLGTVTAYKIGYEIVGKGQDDSQDYTYVSTGAFYLASGALVKLDASEMVTYGGSSEDSKLITMIQVTVVK